jgi:hypothetical protein
MPLPLNRAYDETLAQTYRRIARVILFELEVQNLAQNELVQAAWDIADTYQIPIKMKASSLSVLLSALLNDNYLEMMKRMPHSSQVQPPVKIQKLAYLTSERLAVLLAALGLTPADFSDRFLIHLPWDVGAVLQHINDQENRRTFEEEEDDILIEEDDFWVEPTANTSLWQRIGQWFRGEPRLVS